LGEELKLTSLNDFFAFVLLGPMRAALLTPPDDMEKLSDVMKWVFQQEERKQDVEHELAAEGIYDWPFRSLE